MRLIKHFELFSFPNNWLIELDIIKEKYFVLLGLYYVQLLRS